MPMETKDKGQGALCKSLQFVELPAINVGAIVCPFVRCGGGG